MNYFLIPSICVLLTFAGSAAAVVPLNSDVTQATIGQTICVPGYTRTVRPSASYTNAIKRRMLLAQGIPVVNAQNYELDHIIPLTLGGHPKSLDNFMLQLWEGPNGAKVKDKLEPRLNRLVCAGKLPLAEAQSCIYKNWQACARQYPGAK